MQRHWYPLKLTAHIRHYIFGDRLTPEHLYKPELPNGVIAEWESNPVAGGNQLTHKASTMQNSSFSTPSPLHLSTPSLFHLFTPSPFHNNLCAKAD